ncbi:hypothetical protein LIER_34788 [Lithospermum erythrorhizon]|uniref:RING-type E3 ubiquitin transferase n=1 Tax=Lithospermum erythrorhizon TaxID=34254 RepID=A0AAV3S383_LITER
MATSSIQEILRTFHSRKLLLDPSFNHSSASTLTSLALPPGSHDLLEPTSGGNSFDADVVLVFTVLLCALICSLGWNAILRCALKCLRIVSSDDNSGNGTNSGSTIAKLANPGINIKALKMFPEVSYSADLKIPGLESECVICLMEFSPGEKIRILPKCKHGFHVKCIDRWLNCHSSCPTCRHCLLETCNKIIDGGDANLSQSSNAALPRGPPQEFIINIAPLEPEGIISTCHN